MMMRSLPSTIWVKSNSTQGRKRVHLHRMILNTTLNGSFRINPSQSTLMDRHMIILILEPSGSMFRWLEISQTAMRKQPPWITSWLKMKYILLQPTLEYQSLLCWIENSTMLTTMMRYLQFRCLPTWPCMNYHHYLQSTLLTIKKCITNLRDGRYSEVFLWWCNMIKQCSTSSRVSSRAH